MRKKKEKLSESSKLPGPGIHIEHKEPLSLHGEMHQKSIEGISTLCKVVMRIGDDIERIEARLDRLELRTHKKK